MRSFVALIVLVAAACGGASSAGAALSQAQLKFAVMDAAGKPQWCDPDYWPIVREGGEQANAVATYAEIKADTPTYAAIVAHEHLPSGELSDPQKLVLYRAWKLLRPVELTQNSDAYVFAYTVMTSDGYQKVAGTVQVDGVVTIASRTPTHAPVCPICLAASTLIETPDGPLPVTGLREGTIVWTQDAAGRRVAAPVVKAGSMDAPPGHLMVHLVLADGRELWASPGHPTADGRTVGGLQAGDWIDGSTIRRRELVPYTGGRTYDLLPAGATGHYWANGILLASTL
jgi:hypothetical protein